MTKATRVLVVEDHAGVGRSWCRALSSEGHAVDLAGSLAEARRLLQDAQERRLPYEVVLVDLGLPDGDGSELLPELEKLRPRPGVAVVSAKLDSERALELWGHCQVEVPKPVGSDTMIALVERLSQPPAAADSIAQFCEAHGLSRNESLLVQRSAQGKSLQEIADELGWAMASLKNLWARVHDKTGLRTRREVISAAWMYEPPT